MFNKDPKPEIARLEELAIQVKSGDIKLPRFQRPFVWRRSDMLKLLDSIYKGYPIGSILIWNSSQRLISERSISGLEVNSSDNLHYPTNYLLDGQQRLTTLCGALYWDGIHEDSIWNISFDLDKEEFVYPKDSSLLNYFPLNKLIKTSDFIKQCLKFDSDINKDKYYKVAEKLLKSLKDYKIAVVKIGDMTIDEVAPIFERINSTGRKLTMVDLMMAATWSNGFDLNEEIEKIKSACEELGFSEIDDAIILRSISASAELGINKEDIQRLRTKSSDVLSSAASAAKSGLIQALEFLRDQINIHDYGYIPYGFQLTYLAEIFRINPSPSPIQTKHLFEWFWYTSATRYFGTSNTGQVSKDLANIRAFAAGRVTRLFVNTEIDISQLLFDKFNFRNATSTTFALLLNFIDPDFTIDKKPIDRTHKSLKSNKFFQAIVPAGSYYEKLNIARVLFPYDPKSINWQEIASNNNLEAHMLSLSSILALQVDDITDFVVNRALIVAHKIEELTNCPVIYQLPDTYNTFSFDQIDDINL